MKEEEFLLKFKEKFKLNGNFRAIFTDGFKQVGNRSTGIGMVIHGENIGFGMSIDGRCSVYSVEIMGVERAINHAISNDWREDLLVLSDNQGVVKDVASNIL